MLRHLDLFSGIGGFALAARMVGGYETVAFCEIEPYCQAVLRKHWPRVPIYDDVRSFRGVGCDVVTGGFPCQPYSKAGGRLGADDDRDLWPHYRAIIERIRPPWVLGENVVGLVDMALDNVLADLEALGYAVRPFDIPACAVGADHERRRIWIVAHLDGAGLPSDWERRASANSTLDLQRDVAFAPSVWGKPSSYFLRNVSRLPARMDRIIALGNAIVPQCAAIFLQAIKECEEARSKVGCDEREARTT